MEGVLIGEDCTDEVYWLGNYYVSMVICFFGREEHYWKGMVILKNNQGRDKERYLPV